ncbi:MAG: radical SAM protein [bacterium]
MRNPVNYITTEVYVIPIANRYVVYAPLKKVAFIANAKAVNFLYCLKEGQVKRFTREEKNFLRFLNDTQLTSVEGDTPIATFENATFKPTEVTLFLTNRCNLRCIYCYASAGANSHIDMPFFTAKRGIDFVFNNALELGKKSFSVGYHGGGEPAMNWKVLVKSLNYAKSLAEKHGMKVYASVATNGVLSEIKLQWIIKNLHGVSLSMDGLPKVQDVHRPHSSGDPSSKSVLRTIETFEESGFPYGIRMTVTAISVNKVLDSIMYLLEHARPKRIQLEPVYNLGRGQNKSLHVEPDAFIKAFHEAKRIADKYGVELFFSSARIDTLTNRFCRSCGEGFSLTPNGNVSACYEVYDEKAKFSQDFMFGYYDKSQNRFMFDNKKLQKLRNRTVENIPWCQGCFCKWHCAGDCANKARHAMVNGAFNGHPRCEITRSLVLDQILNKINESNGTFWAGNS